MSRNIGQKSAQQELVEALRAAVAGPAVATSDVDVVHRGTKIVLPGDPTAMPIPEAIKHLERIDEALNTEVSIYEEVRAFPLDGAAAFMKAMQEKFGWATPVPSKGFFSRPPQMVTVDVSLTEKTQVLWGKFELPGIDGELACGADSTPDGEFVFVIRGTVTQRYVGVVRELAELTRKIAERESLYRGKAVRVRCDVNGKMTQDAPAFISTRRTDPLILPPLVESALQANVFTPVERSQACREAGIPLKRGVILAGPPGTGKTLASQELASRAVKNGWTFILLPDTRALSSAIHFARRYQPCVVFCEDIDCGPASEARGFRLNDLLNTIDGINTKDADIMLVFTTNDTSKIDRTLVRPGRIDAIIEFPRPQDTYTIDRFLRHYGAGRIDPNEPLTESCRLLEGQLPAIIRESVERSKLYALARGVEPNNIHLTDTDIHTAIVTMKAHVEFFQSKKEVPLTPEEQVGRAVGALLAEQLKPLAASLDAVKKEMGVS